MKIINDEIKIPKISHLTSDYIEQELEKRKIIPIRWAIVKVGKESYTLNVSFESNED